jgi:hypothetical protein
MSFKSMLSFWMRKSSLVASGVAITLSLGLLIFFQNCGKAGFDSAQDVTASKTNPADGAPFAYEAAIDTITYNSCNSPNSQGKTFTFKMGSYDSATTVTTTGSIKTPKGGVRLNQNFIDYAYKVLKPDYPNPDITLDQVQQLLKESTLNAKVQPQLSLRSIYKLNRLGNIWFKTGNPTLGMDIIQMLGDLTDTRWATPLLDNSFPRKDKINYADFFNLADGDHRNLNASFHFNIAEQAAEYLRNAFNKTENVDAQIVLGFSYSNEATLISPEVTTSDLMTSAYGRGYQLTFQMPPGAGLTSANKPYHPNNQLSLIEEYDISTGKKLTDAGWDCGAKLKVVRAEDQNIAAANKPQAIINLKLSEAQYYNFRNSVGNINVGAAGDLLDPSKTDLGLCKKMDYYKLSQYPQTGTMFATGIYAGKTYGQIMDIVRRHLPAGDWDINLEDQCVVPKKFSCYPMNARNGGYTSGGTYYDQFKVTYSPSTPCHHNFADDYIKANTLDLYCTEYVTVCVKR